MLHLMVDIETVGGMPDGAIVAVGARLFTKETMSKGFEVYIDPQLARQYGKQDESTMEWWSKQPAEVYAQVFSGRIHPADAALKFTQFVEQHKPLTIWAYPPQFDIQIMQHWFKAVGLQWPFHYRAERCARTMKAWGAGFGLDFEDCYVGISKHLPLDDATAQAKVIQKVMSLKVTKGVKPKAVA
jgi:exodeoxyribonuclease VIII